MFTETIAAELEIRLS
ncbi:unnamed protein product, partial [Rotaria sp. Silwood2]